MGGAGFPAVAAEAEAAAAAGTVDPGRHRGDPTTITVLCTASTLGVLLWRPGSDGAWLGLTLLAVTQFGADAHLKRGLGRVAGTLAGVVIAAIVASSSFSTKPCWSRSAWSCW